jgi:membrane-associated phospholipid phosphatase
MFLVHAPGYIIRGGIITLALFLASWIVNSFLKLSLHALFAFYSATILFRIGTLWGAIALALAMLVGWSRLFLKRHTWFELITGILLGVLGGVVVAW